MTIVSVFVTVICVFAAAGIWQDLSQRPEHDTDS